MTLKSASALALGLSLAVLMLSCGGGGGPAPARPGTPAFFWQAAKENFLGGDYMKAAEHIERLMRSDNEFVDRARPWQLVVSAGLMNGYRELAERYEYGGRANKANPAPFRRRASDYRGMANRLGVQLGEAYAAFEKKQPQGDVEIDFPYPGRGSLAMPPVTAKIAQGQVPTETDAETALTGMIQRGVIQAACAAVGAPGDPAKAQEIMKALPVKAPRAAFELGMADALYEASVMFSPLKGSEPVRQEFLLQQAKAALAQAGDAKDKKVKELRDKIERDLKEVAKTKRGR